MNAQRPTRLKLLVTRGLWFLAVIFGLLAAAHIHNHRVGERKLLALLNGDPSADIASLEIVAQQRRVLCTDREVLGYLETMLLSHPKEMTNTTGLSYHGAIKFSGGGTYDGYLSVRTNGFDISIASQAAEKSFPTHSIFLTPPVPEKVKQIF